MPEGPEIEVMRQRIEPYLTGKRVQLVQRIKHKKFDLDDNEQLRVESVTRVGKRLGIHCVGQTLVVGAGMTGYWRIDRAGPVQPHDIFEFVRNDGFRVVYNDARRFGSAVWADTRSWDEELGVDFADPYLLEPGAGKHLKGLFGTSRKPIKPALLDQSRIAGIGNVYASEILWHLRIHPERRVCDFDRWRALGVATHRILCRAVRGKGVRDNRTTVKYPGRPATPHGYTMEVYDQSNNPCSRCDTLIEQMQQAGRTTYWCPTCQPE